MSATDHRLPCLDGLRACAIALVIFSHGRPQIDIRFPSLIESVVGSWGTLGVDLFFGLSGYLITYLLIREHSAGGISLKKFYLRRGFRILPPLLLFLGVVVCLNLMAVITVPWRSILMSLFFLQNYNFRENSYDDGRFVGHLWSLSAEEQFYLIWPVALVLLGPKRLQRVALGVALAAPGVRMASYFLFPGMRGMLATVFHTTYDLFLWGCLLALYRERVDAALNHLRSAWWFYLIVLFYLLGGPLLDAWGQGYYGLPVGITLRALCVAFGIAWLGQNLDTLPAKVLNAPPLVAIGVLSYSLYLWQELFMGIGRHTFSNSILVSIGASFVAACGSYFLAERPFLGLRRRLGRGQP